MKSIYFTLMIVSVFFRYASAYAELQTVPYVDVAKYLGTWYQISRNVLPFEGEDCICAQQILGINKSGNVSVYNSCNVGRVDGRIREISGEAINDDPASNSKFTVDFHLPNKGKYWIIALGPDYRYAVVSDPSLRSLYILSKTPQLESALYQEAVEQAARQVDTSRLKITPQEGCTYPDAKF